MLFDDPKRPSIRKEKERLPKDCLDEECPGYTIFSSNLHKYICTTCHSTFTESQYEDKHYSDMVENGMDPKQVEVMRLLQKYPNGLKPWD